MRFSTFVPSCSTRALTTANTYGRCEMTFTYFLFFGRQSGLSGLSEVETSRGGSVRIQHRPPRHPSGGGNSVVGASSVVTLGVPSSSAGVVSTNVTHTSRFPKLDECAHFHYDVVDLGPLAVTFKQKRDLEFK